MLDGLRQRSRNGLDSRDSFDDLIVGSGLVDIGDDNVLKLIAVRGEDFLEVFSFLSGTTCAADFEPLVEERLDDPDGHVAIGA